MHGLLVQGRALVGRRVGLRDSKAGYEGLWEACSRGVEVGSTGRRVGRSAGAEFQRDQGVNGGTLANRRAEAVRDDARANGVGRPESLPVGGLCL